MKKAARPEYSYEINPTNFFTLPEQKQSAVLSRFYSLLSSIQEPLGIFVTREPLKVGVGGDVRELQVTRTFLSSTEPLDWILEGQGFGYAVSVPPKLEAEKESWKHVRLADGRLARCFTLYLPSSSLYAAWAHSLLSNADMLRMLFVPVEQDTAVARLARKIHLMRSTLSTNPGTLRQIESGSAVLANLERNATRLFQVTLNALVTAGDAKSLRERARAFSRMCNASLSRFDNTPTVQPRMLEGWGKRLYVELESCDIFYPFVSSDMLEVPGGIMLGVNLDTGAPVIFDYMMRTNYNILILASSGSGKSVTAKLILKRLIDRHPHALAFIVDPEGEYEKVAAYLGIEPIRVTRGEELGFDPFQMFDEPSDAVAALLEIVRPPEPIPSSFSSKCGGVRTLDEFYERLDDDEKRYIVNLVRGPEAAQFHGRPRIGDRTIISLQGRYSDKNYVARIMYLALAKLWQKIASAPPDVPKILVIDEGHLIFRFPSAAKFVNFLARTGRKRNVIFVFISQKVEDVTKTEEGRAFFDNSETVMLLYHKELASDELVSSLHLSPQEREMILGFNRGEALILTKDHRLRAYMMPSGEELEMFGTSPQNQDVR
ncbi:MAG: ATP-binding protein [Thaumarchaeota archaeon]|nr:ATP-binding protein [Nitrososphaerota archaeon]